MPLVSQFTFGTRVAFLQWRKRFSASSSVLVQLEYLILAKLFPITGLATAATCAESRTGTSLEIMTRCLDVRESS